MSGHKCLTSPHFTSLQSSNQMESTKPTQSHGRHLHHLLLLLFLLPIAAASAKPLFPKQALPTKSGYLPINPTTSSAIFYTFYEAQNLTTTSLSKTPLLIWLQGGPGCSSMIGNFFELGPWRVNFHKQPSEPLALEPNPGSWNRIFGLIFIDNPIGTGFSIASSPQEIPRDQLSVAKDLFAAITKFIELDPVFKTRPIYITGESYAGKYVPAIGYYILKRNAEVEKSKRVNLAGVAIGDGLTDPVIQVGTHAVNAYYSGLINEKQRAELEELQRNAIRLVNAGNWTAATNARNRVLKRLQNMTGLATLYDYTKQEGYKTSLAEQFLRYKEVKTALGANRSPDFVECSDLVGDVLHDDVMKSVKFMVEFLVKKSKVLLYQGQYDLRDGAVSTEAWVKTMKWEGIGRFMVADRKVWKMGKEVAGYVQKWGSLSEVFVSGAGHLLPADQPLRAQKMIEDWVLDQGLFGYGKENNLSSNFAGPTM